MLCLQTCHIGLGAQQQAPKQEGSGLLLQPYTVEFLLVLCFDRQPDSKKLDPPSTSQT